MYLDGFWHLPLARLLAAEGEPVLVLPPPMYLGPPPMNPEPPVLVIPPQPHLGPPPLNPGYEYEPGGDVTPPLEFVGVPIDYTGSGP